MLTALSIVAGLLVSLLGAALYARRIEPRRIEVTYHDVASRDLPPELDGFTICQVSDVHVADHRRQEDYAAAAIRSAKADLYVLTGDMIYGRGGIERLTAWLSALGEAIQPTVAVPGNAEHKLGIELGDVGAALEALGIPFLVNQSLRWRVRGIDVQIVGVDDPHTEHADFELAYQGTDPALWTLVLSHSPDGVADIGDRRADLVLCGHTHGGQVRLPLFGAIYAHTRRVHGIVSGRYGGEALSSALGRDASGMTVYVSRGLGRSGVPYRFLCRPELPVFTLRRIV